MSNNFFLAFAGSSQHVEDVVVKYLGRDARVTPREHQGRQGYLITVGPNETAPKSTLAMIQSEVQHGRNGEWNEGSRRAGRRGSDANSDRDPHRQPPASDLSIGIRGQSHNMRPPPIPENSAMNMDDDLTPSRHGSRAESNYSGRREYSDVDSAYGSMPSSYGSPSLSKARIATHPDPIPSGERRHSSVSTDSANDFDDMYGFRSLSSQSSQSRAADIDKMYGFNSSGSQSSPRDRHSSQMNSRESRRR